MKIGILGSGDVAQALGAGLAKHGHAVMLGSRDPAKLADWKSKSGAQTGTFAEAAKHAEVVFLCVKGTAAASALEQAGAQNLADKPVVDTCNPIADAPPVNGVVTYFTGPNDSLMERLQKQFANAHFVKAFNSVGAPYMCNPKLAAKPTMFICGNHDGAKKTVGGIVEQLGWEVADMGKVESARAIEPLCQLWCIPGIGAGDWSPRAFKLVKVV